MGGARRYHVRGIVQGVGYRFFAERAAVRLKIRGYVRNLNDGRVEVYAIGDEDSLQALRAELARGPSEASVTQVMEQDAPLDSRYENSFSIDYDA
jgi:acylphosphatase